MKKFCVVLGFVWVLAVTSLLGMSSLPSTEVINKSFSIITDANLNLSNLNGNVKVEGWEQKYVKIIAKKSTTGKKNELTFFSPNFKITDSLISISTETKKKNIDGSICYEIFLPKNVKIEKILTLNGNIELKNCLGISESIVNTNCGNIKLENCSTVNNICTSNGTINSIKSTFQSLSSLNGGIIAKFENIMNSINLDTKNGDIEVCFCKSSDVALELTTALGNIDIENSENQIKIEKQSDYYLSGSLGNGKNKLKISTAIGNVKVDLI